MSIRMVYRRVAWIIHSLMHPTQAKEMGYDGKTLIHPTQVAVANDVFAPTPDQVTKFP